MQKMYPRTNIAPFQVSEDSNAKPVPQIEDALREFALQNAAHIRHEPENTSQVVERVAGVSLSQLQNVISDLQQLHDFLHNEGERIQREISDYLQLSQTAMGSTKMIADNIVQWKKAAHSTARAPERGDFAGSALPPPPSSTATEDAFIPPK